MEPLITIYIFSCWCPSSASSWRNRSNILEEAHYQTGRQWEHPGVPLCHRGRPPSPDYVVPQRCQGARHWEVPGRKFSRLLKIFPILFRSQFVKLLRMIRKHLGSKSFPFHQNIISSPARPQRARERQKLKPKKQHFKKPMSRGPTSAMLASCCF